MQPSTILVVLAGGVAALVLSACGGGATGRNGVAAESRQGGSIVVDYTSQPDFLDPALSDSVEGWEANWNVYTPLLTYRHTEGKEGAELVPGLARALPTISSDGKTYTLELRSGLRYSNGQPVKAGDFKYSVKRLLKLSSPGAGFFEGVVGAKEYERAGKPNGDIRGIVSDDTTRKITIELEKPQGDFSYALGLMFSAPVPRGTPFKNLSAAPPPGVGAYRYRSSNPGQGFVLVKNSRFDVPGLPKGHLDRITVNIVKSQQKQTEDVLDNKIDFMIDPPPVDLLPEVRSKAAARYREVVTNSTYYWFMNTRVRPFSDPGVRQAVNYGVDKPALAKQFGGLLEIDCNFLPPGMLGYSKIDACPWGDPRGAPDLARARQLVQQAGARGAKVIVWGIDEDPTKALTEAYADQLNRIGLAARPKLLSGDVYFQTIGNQDTKAQTGVANWFEDFPHPADFFSLVDGAAIQQTNNHNYGDVDDPVLNAQIAKLNTVADLRSVADRWAALDRLLISKAYVVPYGHRKLTTVMSDRMNFKRCNIFNPVFHHDYSSFCLR